MESRDNALLNIIQKNFPIASRPYQVLGAMCDMSEAEAFGRIESLRAQGIIRRLGGVFDSHRLGYQSTLCSAKVPEEKIPLFSAILNEIPGVTHNYLRNHPNNIWFTLIAPSEAKVQAIFQKIRELSGVEEIQSLPSKRVFKIDVNFRFGENKTEQETKKNMRSKTAQNAEINTLPQGAWQSGQKVNYLLASKDKALVRVLQDNLPQSITPYLELAQDLGWSEEELLERAKDLFNVKAMRRMGAVLRHQKAGFTANAMGVWTVDPDKVDEVGEIMATFKEVSHCYERPSFPGWPYNLFTMIHGHSTDECKEIMAQLSQVTGVKDYHMLFSLKELKKTSMRYYLEDDDENEKEG